MDHGPIGAGGGIHPLPAHSACHLEQVVGSRYKATMAPTLPTSVARTRTIG